MYVGKSFREEKYKSCPTCIACAWWFSLSPVSDYERCLSSFVDNREFVGALHFAFVQKPIQLSCKYLFYISLIAKLLELSKLKNWARPLSNKVENFSFRLFHAEDHEKYSCEACSRVNPHAAVQSDILGEQWEGLQAYKPDHRHENNAS